MVVPDYQLLCRNILTDHGGFISDWLKVIPMAALVAVMIMVSIGTFNWDSLRNIRQYPLSSNIVMIATVVVVVATHNLAYGVLIGVLLSALFLPTKLNDIWQFNLYWMMLKIRELTLLRDKSSSALPINLQQLLILKKRFQKVVIDVSQAHFWDVSAVAAVDKVVIKFKREGTEVELIGMNEASQTMVENLVFTINQMH